MKSVIFSMYSGRLDSVGVLCRLLVDDAFAAFDVHVHHMHVVNRGKRAVIEERAAARTLGSFRDGDHRPFRFTQSLYRYDFMRKGMVWDMDLCAFVAGNICAADPNIAHVVVGRTRADLDGGGEFFLVRMERAQKIFQAATSLDEAEASYVFPVVESSKAKAWAMLLDPLRRANWSCRRPVYDEARNPSPCGKCYSCRERATFGA